MPYIRSNWEGSFYAGGRFETGQVHSVDNVKLVRPLRAGPRGCFLHVTMEHEARVSYLEMVISAKSVEIYVLKGGQGASGEYLFVGKLDGRQAIDHPFKYHYKFGTADLPETKIALIQLRLTPHAEGATEVHLFRLSVMVGEPPRGSHHRSSTSSFSSTLSSSHQMASSISVGGSIAHLQASSSSHSNSTSMVSKASSRGGGGGIVTRKSSHDNQVALGRSAASQQLAKTGGGNGGEAAVVADALNDVMGKMLTVVTKKTKGYVGSTYKKTEDKIQARMKSMEEKISGFEQVVCQNLERRLLDLEHVMDTLNARISPTRKSQSPDGLPQDSQRQHFTAKA